MEERKHHFERPTMQKQPSMVSLSLLTVILAVVAGFGGFLIAKYFFPISVTNYPSILGTDRPVNVNIEQPLTTVALKYQDSVAGLYRSQKAQAGVGLPVFSPSDYIGAAVVVTSDGWLMTTDQAEANLQTLIVLGDKIFDVKELKSDKFTGAVFLRIEASSLSPVDFQLTDSLRAGETLFTDIDQPTSINHAFFSAELNNPHFTTNAYLSSDAIDYYLQITTQYTADSQNLTAAPYFNLQGDLVGIEYNVAQQRLVLPAQYLRESIKHLLNGTSRPILGIRYVDMENHSGFLQKGNLVYSPSGPAVVAGSSAAKAGIKNLDQIVAVNNDVITQNRSLTSIIQTYRIGDTVILKVLRSGIETDVSVDL